MKALLLLLLQRGIKALRLLLLLRRGIKALRLLLLLRRGIKAFRLLLRLVQRLMLKALRLHNRLLWRVRAVRLLRNGGRQPPPLLLLWCVGSLRLLLRLVSNDRREPPPLRLLAVQPVAGGHTNTVHGLSSLRNRDHTRGPRRKTRRSVKTK
jgi:hypothetical protein